MSSEESFICAACGNACCSQKCHWENVSSKDLCYF